ncbi:MAG: type IV secretory system conjugative DNA transfer family protein [Pyrinomonadaceae bacterium]
MFDFPVDLEPPFRPFYYFEPDKGPITDDGRIPTFFSRIFGGLSRPNSLDRESLESFAQNQDRYQTYIAEADEPEFCGHYHDDFQAVQLVLPKDFKVIKAVAEHFLLSLAYAAHPISFEVIGNSEKIVVQFAATQHDFPQLRQQLEAHLPDALLHGGAGSGYLADNWLNTGDSSVIADFALSREFFLPLDTIKSFEIDPLTTIVGAMSELDGDEAGILQVLFQKAKHDWTKQATEAILRFDKTTFFAHIPDVHSLAKQKLHSPLFAVVLRVAGKSTQRQRALQIVRNIGSGISVMSHPAGNELIPLSNDGYSDDHHEQALLDRQSYRNGMLLNADELVSLVHAPSQAVRSEKLIRDSLRTKVPPSAVLGGSLVLGKNHHLEELREVTLTNDQRTRHVHVVGASGSGKSTFLLNLIKQDMESGEGLCVIDPHGDLIDAAVANVPESRIDDCILFDPSDADYPVGFNILQAKTDLEKTILSSDLVATFRRMSTSWGDVMDSVLANAVLAIVESSAGGTLFDLKRFLIEKDFRQDFLRTVEDDSIRYFWTDEFPLIANKPQASILIRLDTFLRQKLVRNIVCQKESKLNFRETMDGKKILFIKLSQGLIGEENAFLLGTLLVSRLYQAALSRQGASDRPYFWLYLDEFQHFITRSMEGILSGSRKYNLGLTLSHQEFRQLQSRNQEVASSVLSNCYTRICFRLGDSDAEKFAAGFSFFDAKSLQNLGIGEAIGRIERSEYDFNLRVPLLPPVDAELSERKRSKITDRTREKFARPKSEVELEFQMTKTTGVIPIAESETRNERETISDVISSNKIQRSIPAQSQISEPNSETVFVAPEIVPFSKPKSKSGHQQHQYLQSLVKRMAENKGFRVTIEKEVFGGVGRIDVACEGDSRKIACEISVTNEPDYEIQNIRKCISAGYSSVLVISPDTRHLEKIRQKAKDNLPDEYFSITQFLTPEEFPSWLDCLASTEPEGIEKVKGYKVKLNLKAVDQTEQATRRRAITDVVFGTLKRLKNKNSDK